LYQTSFRRKGFNNMTEFLHRLGAAANRRYTVQLDDFMKFDYQDCICPSRSAAVAELKRSAS
jgi:hypothetical protein